MAISMWPIPGASTAPSPQVSSPPPAGFSEVSQLLASVNLGSFEGPLKGLGVETVTDLKYVTETDLREMKMTVIQGRKFAEILSGIITGGVVSAPPAIADTTAVLARQRSRSRQRGAADSSGGTAPNPGKYPAWQDKTETDGSKSPGKDKTKQSWKENGWKDGGWKNESSVPKAWKENGWQENGWKKNGWQDLGENGGKWKDTWKDEKSKWGSWKDDKSGKDEKSWKKTKSSWKDDSTQSEPKSKSSCKDIATQPEPASNETQTQVPEAPKPPPEHCKQPEIQPKQQAAWAPLAAGATAQGAASKGGGLLVAKAGSAKAAVHVVQTPGRSPVVGTPLDLSMLPLPPPSPALPPLPVSNTISNMTSNALAGSMPTSNMPSNMTSNVLAQVLGSDSVFKHAETLLKQNGQRKFYWEEVTKLRVTYNLSERTELALKLLDPTKLNKLLRESGDLEKMIGNASDKDELVRSLIKIYDSDVDHLVTQLEVKELEINGPR